MLQTRPKNNNKVHKTKKLKFLKFMRQKTKVIRNLCIRNRNKVSKYIGYVIH